LKTRGPIPRVLRACTGRKLAHCFLVGLGLLIVLALIPARSPDIWSEARADFSVRLPASAVWQRLQDLRLAHHYVPGVEGVEILTARERGVGASRRILQEGGGTLDETVIEWEEGRGFVIRLHRGQAGPPAPFEKAHFRYWIESADETQTRLSLRIFYRPRGGLLGEWLDAAVLNAEMDRRMKALASGMQTYYEAAAGVR